MFFNEAELYKEITAVTIFLPSAGLSKGTTSTSLSRASTDIASVSVSVVYDNVLSICTLAVHLVKINSLLEDSRGFPRQEQNNTLSAIRATGCAS